MRTCSCCGWQLTLVVDFVTRTSYWVCKNVVCAQTDGPGGGG